VIFARRGKRGPDPHLPKKVQLFFLAAALALVGMALESSLLVGLAILALAVGLALRFLPGSRGESGKQEMEGGESHADEDPNPS
jgi:hypothetical protein